MSRDALVVGINTYQSERLANLLSPGEDAEAIAQLLEQYGDFQLVRRLPEAIDEENQPVVGKRLEVDLKTLKTALVQLFKPEGKNIPDTALFYFSGHGLRNTLGISEGFLATSDVHPDFEFYGLSMTWLRKLLEESPIRQQIIWLDCCHSGELLVSDADPGDRGQARDRCFIAASREFEAAYQDLDDRYSVLTKVLLEGLDPQRTPQRWVTNISLVDYLNQTLTNATQRPIYSNFGEPINLTRLRENALKTSSIPQETGICPYKGLQYFDCNGEDSKYFYGRRELTDHLVNHVRHKNFLAIVGASGSGKSSVLRAGLLHRLQLGQQLAGSDRWEIRIFVPGEHPMQNLAAAFVDEGLERLERAAQLGKVEGLLKEGSEGLRRLLETSNESCTVLVVDQFEEAFTLCKDARERDSFFECLMGALAKVTQGFRLIMTLRADFLGKCFEQNYHGLAKQIEANLVTVTPMTEEQLREAILKPAERVNLEVDSSLVTEILRDIKHAPGYLPLLQYTLSELWNQRRDNRLELSTYSQLGGIEGTLDKRATAVYQGATPEEQKTIQHIFLCLTQLGEGTEDTRRRVFQNNLVTAQHPESLIEKVVQKLAKEKLIVTSEQVSKGRETVKLAVVDVAHEALIRHWQQLQEWLRESREAMGQQRKIERAATEWREQQQKKDYLLQGRRLREAKEFQKVRGQQFPLSKEAEIYLERSARQQWQNRFTALGVFLILPLIGTYFGFREYQFMSYRRLITDCQGKETCSGRIEALEELVKVQRHLKNANLIRANLDGANLNGANLDGANLRFANLTGASLYEANLRFANLNGANLNGANLNGANLNGANLNGASLYEANLNGANLNGAHLDGAKLNGANLDGANLTRASLDRAYLTEANLTRANLDRAYLTEAKLDGANLTGASLNKSILLVTDFRETNLNPDQLQGEQAPFVCGIALPKNIVDIDPNRDCDKIAQVLTERYPGLRLEEVQKRVNEAKQKQWE